MATAENLVGRYECKEPGHNKYWELTKIGSGMYRAKWGKIDYPPQGQKEYDEAEATKVRNEKVNKKNYRKVGATRSSIDMPKHNRLSSIIDI